MPAQDPRSSRRRASRLLLALLLLAAAAPASAEEAAEEGWREKPNLVSLILAGTSDSDEDVFTLGLDYEHRIDAFAGLGAVVEYATQDIDAVTLLGVVDFHPWRGLGVQTGPGIEFVSEEERDAEGTRKTDKREFVYRVGVFYEVELGELVLTPQVHYDYSTGKDALIYGAALGFHF